MRLNYLVCVQINGHKSFSGVESEKKEQPDHIDGAFGIGYEWNNVINSGIKSIETLKWLFPWLPLSRRYCSQSWCCCIWQIFGAQCSWVVPLYLCETAQCVQHFEHSGPSRTREYNQFSMQFNSMRCNAIVFRLFSNCRRNRSTIWPFVWAYTHGSFRYTCEMQFILYERTTVEKNLIIIIITITKFDHCLQLQPYIMHVPSSKLHITYNLYYCCHSCSLLLFAIN